MPERNPRIARDDKYLNFRPAHKKPFCQPHDLVGDIHINKKENFSTMASKIESSGYEPINCLVSSGKRVAIIVPFRDDGSKGNRRCLGPKDKNQIEFAKYY